MTCQFLPDVTFVCRDLQHCVLWCVAGWGIVNGGVKLTGSTVGYFFIHPGLVSFYRTETLTSQPAQTHMYKLALHDWDTLWNHRKRCFWKPEKQWFRHWVGKLFCLGKYWRGVRRLGTLPPNFLLNLFLFLFFPFFLSFLSSSPQSFLTKTWKSFMKSGWGFSRSGYLSRAQWGGTPVWRPTPPIKGIASE